MRLQPRAGRKELAGMRNGGLLVRVTTPPDDERASRALCKLIAQPAGVAPSSVTTVRGSHGRDKLVEVDEIDAATLNAALGVA